MAVCPFATRKLIPAGSNDPRITPRVAILHVDAGNAESLYDYFNGPSGGIESHFHIKKTGEIEQYRDTDYQADANNLANDFAISIETQGYGEGEWTDEQIASIKWLLVWLHDEHGIPLVKCPRWDGAGIGYHVQFGAPGPWTPVSKSCPGPDRIKQYDNVLVPWMAAGADLQEEEPEMQLSDDIYPDPAKELTVGQLFRKLDRFLAVSAERHQRITELLKQIDDAVDANADKDELKKVVGRTRDQIIALLAPEDETGDTA